MKSVDEQIKAAMAQKVVGRTTEIYQAVVLALDKRITANSLQVGLVDGTPGLTGRYYASQAIAWGWSDRTVREPNPAGEEPPYPGLPLNPRQSFRDGYGWLSRPYSEALTPRPRLRHNAPRSCIVARWSGSPNSSPIAMCCARATTVHFPADVPGTPTWSRGRWPRRSAPAGA
jgi:hypothetical protein